MKVYKFLFSIILLIDSCFAAKAIITVLEAPLLQHPDKHSRVLQLKRKGEKIYIHRGQLNSSPDDVNYNVNRYGLPQEEIDDKSLFYKTVTRDGMDAYIPKKYVKVLYNDARELNYRTSISEHDETDYRIEEPLPKGYPILEEDHARALILYGIGPSNKTGYIFDQSFDFESYSSRQGLSITYTKKVGFDKTDRFYFGGVFQIFSQNAEFLFLDDRMIKENHSEVGIGPFISFDVFRTDKYKITVAGALIVNYHRSLVSQRSIDGTQNEERLFTGYSLTPKMASYFTWRDVIPRASLDLVVGAEVFYRPAYAVNSATEPQITNYWSDSNQVNFKASGLYSLYMGFQANY